MGNKITTIATIRPKLSLTLNKEEFLEYYYLKSELIQFAKDNNLQTTGSKNELTERIYFFLKTGEKKTSPSKKRSSAITSIDINDIIEENFVFSETRREFFKKHIGKTFSFNVPFQKWLKNNSGKTYSDAVEAYHEIIKNKKLQKNPIDSQFQYNTYIRDFFNDNKDKTLKQAIACWKYKKGLRGNNKYERSDLIALSIYERK